MNEQKKLSKRLQERKEINIPSGNLISKEELEKAIKDNIVKYKEIIFGARDTIIKYKEIIFGAKGNMIKYEEIIFGVDSPICIKCLDELWKQKLSVKVYDQKVMVDTVRSSIKI